MAYSVEIQDGRDGIQLVKLNIEVKPHLDTMLIQLDEEYQKAKVLLYKMLQSGVYNGN